MSSGAVLAAKIRKNRQLRLLAAQRRHIRSRFKEVFGSAKVRTTRLNSNYFESNVYLRVNALCSLHIASAAAESAAEAEERAHGAALSLVNTKAGLRHMLQCVDSDVFAELDATLKSMDAKVVVHLLRVPDSEGGDTLRSEGMPTQFMTTVTAELPLSDAEPGGGWEELSQNEPTGGIAICRGEGGSPRDAIKVGFALALEELDRYAVEELESREVEAWRFLNCYEEGLRVYDWDGDFLSLYLCGSLCASQETTWWSSLAHRRGAQRVKLLSREGWESLSLVAVDSVENETELRLPLTSPPEAFRRIVLSRNGSAVQLQYGSALAWPSCWVVGSVLMRLCGVLQSALPTCDTSRSPRGAKPTPMLPLLQGGVSFRGARALLGLLQHSPSVMQLSIERGLFALNGLAASRFVSITRRPCLSGCTLPVIALDLVPASGSGGPLLVSAHLRIVGLPHDESGAYHYRKFLEEMVATSGSGTQAEQVKLSKSQDGRSFAQVGLLGNIWRLICTAAAAVAPDSTTTHRDFTLWSPSVYWTSDGELQKHRDDQNNWLLDHIGELFSRDAQVSEVSIPGDVLNKALLITSESLGMQSLQLCHVVRDLMYTFGHFLYRCSLTKWRTVLSTTDSTVFQLSVQDTVQQQQYEQSAFYCPDLLLMLQDIRLALRLPQCSFPVLEFFQKAVHDVPLRVRQIAAGNFGDVDVYTRIVAHWGTNLRVEMESGPQHGVCEKVPVQPDNEKNKGPLRLLFLVVSALYNRVFPRRVSVPLIGLNSPTARRSIDFLLHSWFMAPPQVRCFEIDTRAARWLLGKDEEVQLVADYIVRAMLFYDFLGQRVLFAETHAPTVEEAVRRVNELAVLLNMPDCDNFPRRPGGCVTRGKTSGAAIGYCATTDMHVDSEVAALLEALETTTRTQPRVCFVSTGAPSSPCVEGVVEVLVSQYDIRTTATVKESRGVIPSLSLACREALRIAARVVPGVGALNVESLLQVAADAAPLLPRDGFPHFDARFYTPANLLGELLQGVAGRYDCTYTSDTTAGEIVCSLHIHKISIYENSAHASPFFLLGVGRGRTKRDAWAAAAVQALRGNFPEFQQQLDRHRALCELLLRPNDLFLLGLTSGFTVTVSRRAEELGGGFECRVKSVQSVTASGDGDRTSELVITRNATHAAHAYIEAVDSLLLSLRRDGRGGVVDYSSTGGGGFARWDPTSNYAKSVWHACYGALGVAVGGKVALRFERVCEDDGDYRNNVPVVVRLVVRTLTPEKNDETGGKDGDGTRWRTAETGIVSVHQHCIAGYNHLAGASRGRPASGGHVLFVSTRLLSEAVEKYVDNHTREEMGWLLSLLQWRKGENNNCPRLNIKRRIELLVELTFGCQCRVVVNPSNGASLVAQAGIWLPGPSVRSPRVPMVIAACSARTTAQALLELQQEVNLMLEPLWAMTTQVCSCSGGAEELGSSTVRFPPQAASTA
ncbi:hypothetical protein, conserved [Trypanosoma brucei brucei TREU927]|uniref:Uncharacterized protein n=1 Tax=Trypanosoma brucei brucei (strain 927/4 GUTat10.1) TaxID=185431 RepID=Q582L8_TRYB2|nr:hypothetical protein, conserved [Trypanosoma brucei brucei TREU927]AAX80311.1 hypothetical protein, conserved [Trypanosoma brucei]AAZ12705.1 hypothetical protein, conserved [Trypanosoma brucei brucei TREU927]